MARPSLPVSLYLTDAPVSDADATDPEARAYPGRRVVLVGDGPSAERRLGHLQAAGADVVHLRGRDIAGGFTSAHCTGAALVMAHTDQPALDRRIVEVARSAGCLCYAHDQPDVSDFAMPAVARRGPLSVAVATSGTAPALARRARWLVQDMLDRAGVRLDGFMDELRAARARLPASERAMTLNRMAQRLRLSGAVCIDPTAPEDREDPQVQSNDR